MEKCFYPRQNTDNTTISYLLPHTERDSIDENLGLLKISSVVDGVNIKGMGLVRNHGYKWKMAIESEVKSIAVIPDRFFDIEGKSYTIDQERKVSVTSLPTYNNYKDAVIYKINTCAATPPKAKIIFDDFMESQTAGATSEEDNSPISNEGGSLVNYLQNEATTSLFNHQRQEESAIRDEAGSVRDDVNEFLAVKNADYLAIIVDNDNEYHALVGRGVERQYYENSDYIAPIQWYQPSPAIITSQFKNIDMWLRFQSINEMIYFLLTKYEDNILDITPVDINPNEYDEEYGDGDGTWAVNKQKTTAEPYTPKGTGKLWAYVNPRTMTPYDDDYWFHQGESYYVKSLTFAPKGKILKGHKIVVKADQWPGMYMMVGETHIRNRDTGEDERMQIKFPLCKVKSDQSFTLEADGDPTVFNLDLEVARPASGVMMELTSYEIAEKLMEGDNGCFYAIDGSTQVLSE